MIKHFTLAYTETAHVHMCLQYRHYSIYSIFSSLLINRRQGFSLFYSLWHHPLDCTLVQRVLWQLRRGAEEEILQNVIQSETSLRENFMTFGTSVLLSKWMKNVRVKGSLGVVTLGCSEWLFCVGMCVCVVVAVVCYPHWQPSFAVMSCNGEEQNDRYEPGNRCVEQ